MNIGLGIGIPFAKSQIWLSLFDPSKLFTAGVNGAWYDPSDINLTWRRNLLTYSEQFDNAVWVKLNSTVTANAIIAPDGTLTADKLVETTATAADHYTYNINIGTLVGSYTYSIYAKAGERQYLQLAGVDNGVPFRPIFDLSNGTVVSFGGVSAFIQPVGSGWYRCGWTKAATALTQVTAILQATAVYQSYTGDGTSGIYIWGAQLEVGSTATPYQRITDGVQDYLQYQAQPVLYRDAAGTLPVTAIEQPVGLMLDKSKQLVLGPELVADPSFDSPSAWSVQSGEWVVSGGKATYTNPGGTGNRYVQSVANVEILQNKTYVFEFTVSGISSGVANFLIANKGATTTFAAYTNYSNGTYKFYFQSVAAVSGIAIYASRTSTTALSFSIDNISVRELPGNHAFNSSGNSANFPVLSARYNLLTKTDEFDGGVWAKFGATISANTATAPDGTMTADRLVGSAGWYMEQAATVPIGASCTISCYAKSNTGVPQTFRLYGCNNIVSSNLTATTEWKRFTFSFSATTGNGHGFARNAASDPNDILMWGADLRVANDALNQPAYQRVNTSTDYDTVGFKPYLKFNGTNQWLQTNSIDFTYGDKMFVSAGVRKLNDGFNTVVELSNSDTNAGMFYLRAAEVSGNSFGFLSRGTNFTMVGSGSGYPAPITNVISGIGNIGGDQAILRINGAQAATSISDQGTGNYGNYPLYIGARAGSSLWFNGRLYGMVVAGKQASNTEIQDTEKYIAVKTGFGQPLISGIPSIEVIL